MHIICNASLACKTKMTLRLTQPVHNMHGNHMQRQGGYLYNTQKRLSTAISLFMLPVNGQI